MASPTPEPTPATPDELTFPNPPVSDASVSQERGPIDFDIGEATLWGDVVARLSDDEATCIRAALGEERYEWVLDRPALQDAPGNDSSEPWADYWQVLFWGCLEQATALDLFWSTSETAMKAVVDSMQGGLLGPIGDEGFLLVEDCLRGLLSYTDFSRFVTAGLPGKSGESRAHQEYEGANVFLIIGLGFCAGPPDQSATSPDETEGLSFLSDYEVSWGMVVQGVTAPESDCILGALTEADDLAIDRQVFDGMTEPWEVPAWSCLSQQNAAHLFEVSDPYLEFSIGRDGILEYGGDDIECIREALLKVDYPKLIAAGIPGLDFEDSVPYFALSTALAYCWPGDLEGYDGYVNDHIGVVQLLAGGTASGVIDYPDDRDQYRFSAQQGKNYRLGIDSETLSAYPNNPAALSVMRAQAK